MPIVTVLAGACAGDDPQLPVLARQCGRLLAQAGWHVAYGGTDQGLMGELAAGVIEAQGQLIGVISWDLYERGLLRDGLHQRCITPSRAERRKQLLDMGEAVVVLPGGVGTMAELFTLLAEPRRAQPVVLLGSESHWKPLRQLLDHLQEAQLLRRSLDIQWVSEPAHLVTALVADGT